MTFWPVGKNRFLGTIPATEMSEAPRRKHHIWIVDQSGSMGWATQEVADDMVSHLRTIAPGDVITVGYFSGVGDYRWFVKGMQLNREGDYAAVEQIIQKNARSRNTTCFSEILSDVEKVVADIAPITDDVELVFLTDGHPVVPSYDREHKAIFRAIEAIKSKLSSGLLVGYGDYYNKALMAEMAQALGASLQHAEEIKQFGQELGRIVVKHGRKRTTVTLPAGVDVAFALESGRVVVYAVENNKAVVPTGTQVYYVAKDPGQEKVEERKASKIGDPYQDLYALAAMYVQTGDTAQAMEVLSNIGDVRLVNLLGSAMTNREFSDVTAEINEAIVNLNKRFLNGQKVGCAPREDAFDLIDVLQLLQSDNAGFYPNHPEFRYKRIGRKSKTAEGYPKFVSTPDVRVPIVGLVGNDKELNISISTTIPGAIELPDEAAGLKRAALGLPKTYGVNVWRTYNLITNALPNVTRLPVSISKSAHSILVDNGVLPLESKWVENEVYVLDLSAVPACNRARGKAATNWEELAQLAFLSEELSNKLKVIKAKLKELDPGGESKRPVTMTEDQQKFLEANGVKADGTFAPPSIQEEATDVLKIRTFEIKVEKTSSVTMKDFALMLKGDRKMNFVGEMMLAGQKQIDNEMPTQTAAAIVWLSERLKGLSRIKRAVDSSIAAQKYAIALGGYWQKYHTGPDAQYTVDIVGYSAKQAVVDFTFRNDVEKKI